MTDARRLVGKKVLVKAGGLAYTGILVEIGTETVILRSPTGHNEIPVEKISTIDELSGNGGTLPPSPLARKAHR